MIIICDIQKYKKLIKVTLFGKDDIWITNSDSVYKINGNFTNCKRCRFNLNSMLNDILLSKNARLVLESSYIPTITGFFVTIRIVTSTQDINVDTSKYNSVIQFYLLLNRVQL